MPSLLLPALLSAGLCAAVLGVLLRWATRALPLDRPNARSLHHRPVPRIGGVAVMAGILGGWLVAGADPLLASASVILAAVSLADDVRGLSAGLRLAAHTSVAAVFASHLETTGVATVAAVGLSVWMTNLFNFMDGSDGLAGGMAAIGFGAYGMAAWFGHAEPVAATAWCIAAAAGAFLIFNFHPARVFLGDCGSIPLGFLAAALGLAGWQQGLWPAWFPAAVFAPFVLDATVTLARRMVRGEPVWRAHRDHYYQRLVRIGWGHRGTALLGYALMLASAGLALFLRLADTKVQAAGLAALLAAFLAAMRRFDRIWDSLAEQPGAAQ